MNLDFHIRRPDHDFFCFVSGVSFFTSLKTSPNTYQVVDAVVDALTSQAPCDRYLVGSDARFFFVWMAWLPAVVADFIFARMVLKLPTPLGCK